MMSCQGRVELFGGALGIERRATRHSPRGLHPGAATDRHRNRRVRGGHGYPGCAAAPKRAIGLRGPDGEPNMVPDAAIADSVGSKETPGPAVTAPENGVP